MKVLVVEDDPQMQSLLRRGLSYEGYQVEIAGSGEEGLERAEAAPPDLAILDVMLPEMSGLEVCRQIRSFSNTPILMLTAKRTTPDKVAGFEAGADDYLAKPFALDELLVRVKALLRRSGVSLGNRLRCGDLEMDLSAREVRRGNRKVDLTLREFDLLELLLRHKRQVLSRDVILDRIWGYDFGGESNIIDVYIRYLRAKLCCYGEPDLIYTRRGVGYMLKEG